MNSSFVPKLLLARNYKKLGLINTRTNHFKYNKTNGVIAKLGQKFQGALVGLYKDGLYDNLYKADFSSMYPSSIQTFNLGPDTTTLVSVEEYTGKYNCIIKENYNWYRIPTMFDKGEYAYDLIVKIRNDKDGFLKKDITELKAERKKIRKEMETCKPEEKETLNSQQTAIKIILNSIYGVLSDDTSTYGDIICGLTITSMCRWITTQTMRKIGDCVVNVDTDGMIVTKEIKLEELNPWLDKIIKEKFNITDNYMQLGLEEFGRGFFIAMKTYILQEGNKYIRHGSSILSSRSCKIVDKAIDLAIQHVFNNKPIEEVILEAYDFSKCTIDDFTERVKLSMEQSEYNDQNCWQNFLAVQAQDKTGQVITADTQLTYLITKDQLKDKKYRKYYKGQWNYTFYKNVNDIKELNFIYYKELVSKALKKFGIEGIKQLSLDLGFGERIAKELDIFPSGEVL
jgi:DNA polymerase elongation subunit (family B)